MRLQLALCLSLVLGGATAGAQPAVDKDQVVITGIKNPDMRSYRAVVAGLDAFDEYRHYAPLAPEVRFRIQPGKQSAGPAEGLVLRIVGDDDSEPVPLPIDADGVFLVPRIQAAYDSRADLVLNQKKGKFRAQPEVRTPGWSGEVRRLGDLRLECRVRIAIGKYEAPFWIIALVNGIFMTTDWCGHEYIGWPIATDAPLAGAALVHGDRRLELKRDGKQYQAPISYKSWPDDTRIELLYE
ncbi:MAG: hypothetical protein V4693_20080 [Pseudomonadota bacterium]